MNTITVLSQVDSYLLARDVTANYAELTRTRMRRFLRWNGGDFPIADLDSEVVNRFLAYLQTTPASRVTVDNYRRTILAIWRDSYLGRLNDNPPLRVRAIRRPKRIVNAFTADELRLIISTAGMLPGYFPNGVKRADFWVGIVYAAYGSALRRGDLLRIKKADIRTDGLVELIQSKTGYPITVVLPQESLAAIRRMPVELELAFPWPYHCNAMPRQFRALVKAAGVRPGQFKWIRATAGSYIERDRPGFGSRLLGHRSTQVFQQHYDCPAITRSQPVTPPPLSG